MGNKRIQDLPSKGTTIAANDILELSEYQSPGVYISKKILGSELGGVSTFTALTDTPASYTGQTLKFIRVNAGETALEFATVSVSDTNIANTQLTLPTGTRKLIWGGANSTDVLQFRNSTDTVTMFEIYGTGEFWHRNTAGTASINWTGSGFALNGTSGVTVSNAFSFLNFSGTTIQWSAGGTNFGLRSTGNLSFYGAPENGTGAGVLIIGNGTAPTGGLGDKTQIYSADVVAGNATMHVRTENGAVVKLYQETTGVTASTFVANTSGIVDDTATFDGYTLGQVVKALRNLGILA